MPYIRKQDRILYDEHIQKLNSSLQEKGYTLGHVNYVISSIIVAWWNDLPCYATICEIIGTLAGVSAEFYRKIGGPYEETKEKENGPL